jgi:hypothetical protein
LSGCNKLNFGKGKFGIGIIDTTIIDIVYKKTIKENFFLSTN